MPVKKIMIVEDEMMIAADIEESLRSMGHRVVAIVSSGVEAMAQAQQLQPDLILMDIMLKGPMDGISVAESIHQELGCAVIFLTAYADNKTLQRVKKTEPFGYILKPFREKELHAMVDIALYKHDIEKQARQQQLLLDQTLQHTADGLVTLNRAGEVCFLNPAAERLTGYTAENAIGQHIAVLLNNEHFAHHSAFRLPFLQDTAITVMLTSETKIQVKPILDMSMQPMGAVVHLYALEASVGQKSLQDLISVCASCKKIRSEDGHRYQFESYLNKHFGMRFSHGICPDCSVHLYPDYFRPTGHS